MKTDCTSTAKKSCGRSGSPRAKSRTWSSFWRRFRLHPAANTLSGSPLSLARRVYELAAKDKKQQRRRGDERGENEPGTRPADRLAQQPAHEERASHAEGSDERPAALVGAAPSRRRQSRHRRGHCGAEYELAKAEHHGAGQVTGGRSRHQGVARDTARNNESRGAEKPERAERLDAGGERYGESCDDEAVTAEHEADVALAQTGIGAPERGRDHHQPHRQRENERERGEKEKRAVAECGHGFPQHAGFISLDRARCAERERIESRNQQVSRRGDDGKSNVALFGHIAGRADAERVGDAHRSVVR